MNAASPSSASRNTSTSAAQASPEPDELSLSDSTDLAQTLAQTPAARPEKVAQARALLHDTSFPSESQVSQIADLLARNLLP